MGKINVLFFIYQMGGGGAARTLLNIMNNLDRERFSVTLVTLNFEGSYEGEVEKDIRFIKLQTKRLSRSIFSLARIIKQENIDLVFSTIPRVNTIAIVANRLSLSKAKNVVREADNLGGSFVVNLQLLGFGVVYKFAHQIVSLSEGVKENLVRRYKIRGSRIQVIYNPVDLQRIADKMDHGIMEPKHEELFHTGDRVIITAGRLVPQKDQRTLLQAFAKVNEQTKSKLILLGEGPLKEELQQEAARLEVADRVHFLGFQSNPYVYFKHADVFVLSSIHEGFSHVIAEALATGTPVVSTNCKSGPEEVLDKGKYGFLCKVGDVDEMANKIQHVLTLSPEQRASLIERGLERVQDFDAKQIVKQYETLFLHTLKRS